MLRNGYGVPLPGSFPYYGQIARQAKETGLGIWASEFSRPGSGGKAAASRRRSARSSEECNVKGMLDRRRQPIYLVPTDRDYADAKVDRGRGEQLFCSDEEAREAGWLRAGEVAGGAVR